MSKPDIWMPLYIGDYLADTARLTTEQHGAYLLLIMDYWRNGPPPDDANVLCQITRLSPDAWSINEAMLKTFFRIENGVWRHKRVDQEIESARGKKEKATGKAKTAAAARWGKSETTNHLDEDASSNAQAMLNTCPSPSPSPSPSLSSKENNTKEKSGALATRLPADWIPSESEILFCKTERPDLNPTFVADTFRDHWVSIPGAKGRRLDWPATWRNWVRNQRGSPSTTHPYESAKDKRRRETYENLTGRKSGTRANTPIDITPTSVVVDEELRYERLEGIFMGGLTDKLMRATNKRANATASGPVTIGTATLK